MPVIESKFKASKFLHNGHFQTIYPYFFRKVKASPYKRIRIQTPDHDFLDLDLTQNGSSHLVILSHGLEGSSDAKYIRGITNHFYQNKSCDVLAWNYRGCSGELNHSERFYHASAIEDLETVIHYVQKNYSYKSISLIGFSLGGNLTAFYLGSKGKSLPSEIQSSVLISTPFSLHESIQKIKSSSLAPLYSETFLKTMRQKVLEKQKKGLLKHLDTQYIKSLTCFTKFDEYVTAPLHGFKSAQDYYQKSSSIKLLDNIQVPTLIVQAKDDPFMPHSCFPIKQAKRNKNLFLEVPETGGHLGFMTVKNQSFDFWFEKRACEFLEEVA